MIKRLMLIGLLGLSLGGLSRTNANAQACEPSLLAFYGICFVMDIDDFFVEAGSVDVSSILKQLQNAAKTEPAYEAALVGQEVLVRCKNPAGKTDVLNNGKPFNVDFDLTKSEAIKPQAISKNGKALSELIFTDQDIQQGLGISDQTCADAHPGQGGQNWKLDKVVVTKAQVIGTLFSCQPYIINGITYDGNPNDPRNAASPCGISDSLGKQCTIPAGQDPFKPPFKYSCNTVCTGTNLTNPQGDFCPQPVAGNLAYPTQ